MAAHSYSVEVQNDFLEKITRAKPIQALAELIWNSLDADATTVDVTTSSNPLGGLEKIVVSDNGTGMNFGEAPELFQKLGGSWKRPGATTGEGRFLHGRDGRGRFKAFALGQVAKWHVTYKKDQGLSTYTITMTMDKIRQVVISDEEAAIEGARTGVTLTVFEPHTGIQAPITDPTLQELTEIFALYLSSYRKVSIIVATRTIDPERAIASRKTMHLADISDEDNTKHPVKLEIIEWNSATNRALYLCNDQGYPLAQVDRRFHVGSYQFSAYLQSPYITKLQGEGLLELAEMRPEVVALLDTAYQSIKNHFRSRAADESRSVVAEWKQENVYPYDGDAETHVEKVERQVFDIVAVNVAHYMPDFATSPTKNKAFNLRLLRHAIEKSPEDLQLIMGEVLNLPKRKQEELASLLRDISLSSIIGAAKIVADRLKFLTGLESLLLDLDTKKRLKERSQLHRILAQNCWLFGEEYNLSVNDQGLTAVLRKHCEILDDGTVIDEPVKHVSKERGIVDLVLSRKIQRYRANDIAYLVIELKAPKVKIDKKEIVQIEEYALSIMQDERFRGGDPSWAYWLISDDYGDYAKFRMINGSGKIYDQGKSSIWIKAWGEIIDENRARLQFFQERLEYEADKGDSLAFLQERYADFLKGVIIDETPDESGVAAENTDDTDDSSSKITTTIEDLDVSASGDGTTSKTGTPATTDTDTGG